MATAPAFVAPAADFRIYVACLAAYNAGRLHGRWIDCDGKDADEIQAEVNAMLKRSPEPWAEEWAIHDHEGFPSGTVGESTGFDRIAAMVEALEGLDESTAVGFRFLMWNDASRSVEDAAAEAENVQWTSERPAAAVESYYEESGQLEGLPEWAQYRIDWEGIAHDWKCNGDLVEFYDTEEGTVTILNANSF